jgi:hypothetical protein
MLTTKGPWEKQRAQSTSENHLCLLQCLGRDQDAIEIKRAGKLLEGHILTGLVGVRGPVGPQRQAKGTGLDGDLHQEPVTSSISLAEPSRGLPSQSSLSKDITMRQGTIVDATSIAALSATKNKEGKREHECHQAKKGNQWYVGMQVHIEVDKDSGLIHSL